MLRKLLIANRGEIACRIARTARRLGVSVAAVYSDADAGAKHVREADEAVRIGAAPPAQSYLDAERLIDAAQRVGADAVHPGYGFLAENAEFAAACAKAGLVFVGPPASAIAAMGSKSPAKERMARVGIPVLPGYQGADQGLERLSREAQALGFPLIVKPSGGGGGKGMQIVLEPGQLPRALETAQRTAHAAFGDALLLLERYLPAARHVEVQVFADSHGNVVHLFDRDCSVQRRHQKLLEEAPAPRIAGAVRERMQQAACRVAREIGYVGAGTVEFLLEGDEFFFMEMNTRLQVEHPVTEAITGLDLVEWQLRVATGEPLPLAQAAIQARGCAVEARVCAEDPARGFVPSAGRLALARWPSSRGGVRVDAGFESGDGVPTHYDSLLGKVVGAGATRADALARLAEGLAETRIAGVHTNVAWLARAIAHPTFADARATTAFVEAHGGELGEPAGLAEALAPHAAAALLGALAPDDPRASSWSAADGFRLALPRRVRFRLRRGKQELAAIAASDARDPAIETFVAGERVTVWRGAEQAVFERVDERDAEGTSHSAGGSLTTPLPGVVIRVLVAPGARVRAGETLMVVEAMKMEHAIAAPRDGVVALVHFRAGDRVSEGATLLALEPEAPARG
jgi:3-methylcrotonyl-CoA carboxylase alpha subunit